MRMGVLLGALVLVLAGCSSRDPAGDVRLVPWNDAVPAQLQPTTVAPVALCKASVMKVVGSGFQFAPALSGGTGEVTLRTPDWTPAD